MASQSAGSHSQPLFDDAYGLDLAVDLNLVSNYAAGMAWTNWTPSVGNMTNGGSHQWRYAGGMVQMRGYFPSPNPTGEPGFSLPVAADTTYNAQMSGTVMIYHAGVWWPAFAVKSGSTTVVVKTFQTVASGAGSALKELLISATSPFTWGSGDNLEYELAYVPA